MLGSQSDVEQFPLSIDQVHFGCQFSCRGPAFAQNLTALLLARLHCVTRALRASVSTDRYRGIAGDKF